MRTLLVERRDDAIATHLRERAEPTGEVVVDVEYSGVNYKDGLAMAGRPGVIREHPLVPGIDLAGVVRRSEHPDFAPGDRVVLTGSGLGERVDGGLAEVAAVRAEHLVRLPATISTWQAAAIGTAGFTAMLSVLALERLDRASPYGAGAVLGGDVVVTGAAGGVGTVAIALLAASGRRVIASTGRADAHGAFLRELGAADVVDRAELSDAGKPLRAARWTGGIDSVGSTTLAGLLASVRPGGAVAACGLAQGADLPATVLPFILRAVALTGVDSVDAPIALRHEAWNRLASDLDPALLRSLSTTVPLGEAPAVAERILAGEVRGRTVVDVRA